MTLLLFQLVNETERAGRNGPRFFNFLQQHCANAAKRAV
jgi:hypothetical protein